MAFHLNSSYFPLFNLPDELIYCIFGFVHGCDLARLCRVCSRLNHFIAQDQLVWKEAINSELSGKPLLLSHENYKDFYKRAYLGLYRSVADMVKQRLMQKLDREAETDADCCARYIIEKKYSYGHYLKEQGTQRNNRSKAEDSNQQAHLCFYLCTAAKHSYEVWADKLCQQGAKLCGITFMPEALDLLEDLFICPLYFATRENNVAMVKKIIELGIVYQPQNPQYILHVDDATSSKVSSIYSTIQAIICKVLICIRHDPHLLQPFLNSLKLPPIHQAAIYGNIDELNRLIKEEHADLDMMDNYNMTPLMYSILISREHIVRYIYRSQMDILIGYPLADSISAALGGIEYKVLQIIRQHDYECYEAVIFEAFGDERFFTNSSNREVLQFILADLTNQETFYAACQSAISSRNGRLIHQLISDLPTLLQLYANSSDDVQGLLQQITFARKKVITEHGKELVLDAAQFGQGNCIRELVVQGVQPNMHCVREMLYLGIGIELPSHFAIASNTKYKQFHQFLLQLSGQDFDTNAVVKTLQFYTFAKAIADLPTYQTMKETINRIITEIMCRTMHSDWYQPMFIDNRLQKRVDEISCTLLQNLMSLNKKYDINARDRSYGLRKETALHVASRLGNPAWVQLFLQAGADRQIEDRFLEKPINCVRKSAKECKYLLQNYHSCSLPSKPKYSPPVYD
ncbi:uncharacterized protein TRIADDRAFT_61261 [Trichoplax adhaerens]|uniref:F-box domain-containing protein n=1 Tax=Trichoplax adhaerens TaxID=10228 RepID=B3SAH5_TRIAD|nr:hypothetical protein TRIADDRAFT_61261 [Trichoplax adhaerens]EDV20260.1 hypothetical protein TRIADDRAFT_61261 [Trichoplax adhaerens]|eukprot:XP_002117210.1 hypothetical protein TRIADDRAFT_61261 [Trichoplax adhaerens]